MFRKPRLSRLVQFEYDVPHAEVLSLSDADMYEQLYGTKASGLFLGRFSADRLSELLEESSVFGNLRDKGLWPVRLEITSPEQFQSYLRITLDTGELVGELLVREGRFTPKRHYVEGVELGALDMLFIEWILMQNPKERFCADYLPLPGQRHPPLGVGRKVADLLERACKYADKDGILNFPEFFHNALLYMREGYHFYDPKKEAEVLAIRRDLADLSLLELAWAVFSECVYDEDGRPYRWKPEGILWPNCGGLFDYFESDSWKKQVERYSASFRFRVRADELQKRLDELRHEVSTGTYMPAT